MSFLQKILGGGASSGVPAANDGGFADFAASPAAPSPASLSSAKASPAGNALFSAPTGHPDRPYTKWYRVWERTSPADFFYEAMVLPFILMVIFVNVWGTRANRRRVKGWVKTHAPILNNEFSVLGFGGYKRAPTVDDVQAVGALQAEGSDALIVPVEIMKEEAANEYITYASGRANIAFLDIKINLLKRYNPLALLGEFILGLLFESMPPPVERMEATAYAFDGKEKDLVPSDERKGTNNSTYDGFVFAVVNKDKMKQLRDERYDLSLTITKDNAKLPSWATVMSESHDISEAMLTPELVKAIADVGDSMEAFIVSDQPIDKPTKLQETMPRKRVTLSMRLASESDESAQKAAVNLFQTFIRYPDHLVSAAHFPSQTMKRLRATRDDEIRRIQRAAEDEKAEERKTEKDKAKKDIREAKLRGLSSEEQRKFLEKEREKELRKGSKKMTMRG